MRYQTTRADDAGLRRRMKAVAQAPFRLSTAACPAQAGGYLINHKKFFRLYREERRRGGRKRAIGTKAPMLVPMTPNDR